MPNDAENHAAVQRATDIASELEIRREELALRKQEVSAKIDAERKGLWFSSPLLIAVLSTTFGLIGTGVGAILQGYWNTELERRKFEFVLIQKALETKDKNDAARNLKFLVDAGLINQFDSRKISLLAEEPERLPLFVGAAIRSGELKVRDAKAVLSHIGLFKGEINDIPDGALAEAVKNFQITREMTADGLIGPTTAFHLKQAWPEYFEGR